MNCNFFKEPCKARYYENLASTWPTAGKVAQVDHPASTPGHCAGVVPRLIVIARMWATLAT